MSEPRIIKFSVCAHLDDGTVRELSKTEAIKSTAGDASIWQTRTIDAIRACDGLTSSEHSMLFNLLTMTCAVRVRLFDAPKAFVDALADQYGPKPLDAD